MRPDAVRRLALALPETTEEPHFDMVSFRVRGKIFATVPADGKALHLFVGESEVRACTAADPRAFEELWWGKRLAGVRVHLAVADKGQVSELLEESWRRRAPKRLIAAFDAERRPGVDTADRKS